MTLGSMLIFQGVDMLSLINQLVDQKVSLLIPETREIQLKSLREWLYFTKKNLVQGKKNIIKTYLSELLPSLKLTLRTWKLTPGKVDSYWKPPFFGAFAVSFREGISPYRTLLQNVSSTPSPWAIRVAIHRSSGNPPPRDEYLKMGLHHMPSWRKKSCESINLWANKWPTFLRELSITLRGLLITPS